MKKIFATILALFFVSVLFAQADSSRKQTDSIYKQYVGKYHFPDGSVVTEVTVLFDGGVLIMQSSAGNSGLEKTSNADMFVIVSFEGTAVFKRDDAKKVIGVVIDAMGYHLEGSKDSPAMLNEKNKNLVKSL
ncbi:MAG: hypothetical protein JSR09_01910 [Bacteroidetes bacterium]|nr:hypothetical protein [Bacteroidota bacterium]MBS1648437.1 hypothetical protein [Bacteroidota bacterium]